VAVGDILTLRCAPLRPTNWATISNSAALRTLHATLRLISTDRTVLRAPNPVSIEAQEIVRATFFV
jgi:hypothetical protein